MPCSSGVGSPPFIRHSPVSQFGGSDLVVPLRGWYSLMTPLYTLFFATFTFPAVRVALHLSGDCSIAHCFLRGAIFLGLLASLCSFSERSTPFFLGISRPALLILFLLVACIGRFFLRLCPMRIAPLTLSTMRLFCGFVAPPCFVFSVISHSQSRRSVDRLHRALQKHLSYFPLLWVISFFSLPEELAFSTSVCFKAKGRTEGPSTGSSVVFVFPFRLGDSISSGDLQFLTPFSSF